MNVPPRFYLLDIVRGLASLSVVIWHYQHFYFDRQGKIAFNYSVESQPFYGMLRWFYHHGHEAVQLFFAISGFIFFLTYHAAISSHKVTSWQFTVSRFSRLYPLHIVTLLFVAAAQALSYQTDGHYVVYQSNDSRHFLMQLFLASHWGFQDAKSFNGPIWSLSVEVLLYFIFFLFCFFQKRITQNTIIAISAMLCLSLALQFVQFSEFLSIPAACFFIGGLVCVIFDDVKAGDERSKIIVGVWAIITCIASILIYVQFNLSGALYYIAFPSMILVLALLQERIPNLGCQARVIGDITYSTYLIHFPIQIIIISCIKHTGIAIEFSSNVIFMLFISIVVLSSFLTYHLLELPMQRLCRRKLSVGSPIFR
jgi:peptidoglycan/LPS O-acetylase OafA/YrhL